MIENGDVQSDLDDSRKRKTPTAAKLKTKYWMDQAISLHHGLNILLHQIKEGQLVRDISKDHEPDWSLKVMEQVMEIKEAMEMSESFSKIIDQVDLD